MAFRLPEGSPRFSLPFHVESAPNPGMMGDVEIAIAREKSRLGAALIYAQDNEKRREAEAIFGLAYMKFTYPEAYPSTCARFIDNITKPWW